MRLAYLLLMTTLLAVRAGAADASSDESLVSERLSSRAIAVLDGVLGPGRAKILVEVRGERLQIRSEVEMLTPLDKDGIGGVKEALRMLDMPGYYRERAPPAAKVNPAQHMVPFQKDFEYSLRDAGFEIKKIEATAVLDTALTETEARDAAQLLPQLLKIDASRGDVLTIVRAPMRPAWQVAFSNPGDWRKLIFAAAGLFGALVFVLILAAAFVRGARVFANELTARRERTVHEYREAAGLGEPLPELMPGSPAGLAEAGGAAGLSFGAPPFAALGGRFDFLESADPADAARVLSEEPAADLAQIFAYLAKLAPEIASRLFAKLPPDIQAEASTAILKLKAVDPDRLSEIENKLRASIANGLRGSQRLATILSRFPGDDRAMLLERLAERDGAGVEAVESQLFSFEDFDTLSPADLRRVIGAVPYELWGLALRGAPQALAGKVLAELPDGPRGLVRDEASVLQSKDKVVAARSKLLNVVVELAAKGLVRLERGAGAEDTL